MALKNFSLLEAVEVALNMEEEGIRFYTLAEGKVPQPELKKLFAMLREKEQEHIRYFRRIFEELAAKEGDPDAELWLLDPEISAYFRASVEATVFPVNGAAEKAISGLRSARDILHLGLRAEKDSIHFYQEVLTQAPWPGARELLEKVIAEERRHFCAIYDRLKALGA